MAFTGNKPSWEEPVTLAEKIGLRVRYITFTGTLEGTTEISTTARIFWQALGGVPVGGGVHCLIGKTTADRAGVTITVRGVMNAEQDYGDFCSFTVGPLPASGKGGAFAHFLSGLSGRDAAWGCLPALVQGEVIDFRVVSDDALSAGSVELRIAALMWGGL